MFTCDPGLLLYDPVVVTGEGITQEGGQTIGARKRSTLRLAYIIFLVLGCPLPLPFNKVDVYLDSKLAKYFLRLFL